MDKKNKKINLVVIASHPIQYQCPLFKELAREERINLKVYFCSNWGVKEYFDKGFGKSFNWDINLLEEFNYEFLKNYSIYPSPSRFFGLLNFGLINRLRKDNVDAVWIHGWNSLSNIIAMITCFIRGIPVLLRAETNLLPKLPEIKKVIKKFFFSTLFKKISAFLAIGKFNKEFYLDFKVPEEKIFLVPYCVNNDFFIKKSKELKSQKTVLKGKYNLPQDLPVILFCGKLINVKRPQNLLKAFANLQKNIKASLVFMGDGTLRENLKKTAEDLKLENVYFMGFKNQTEMPELYTTADVFVLPSSFEPWGLVVNEAMCFGLPVIVSDAVGSSADLVNNTNNGFIFKTGDIESLQKNIEHLLKNKGLIEKMGYNSQEIITRWSYKQCIEGIYSALDFLQIATKAHPSKDYQYN